MFVSTTHGLGTWQWEGSNTGSFSGEETTIGSSFALGASTGGQLLTQLNGNTTYYSWYQMRGLSGTISDYPYVFELQFKRGYQTTTTTTTQVTNATGTLVSNAQTVASTTEVSGVFTYTDAYGTNTIGTDLKIYLTANLQGTTPNWTGTNWTEAASYGTATTFSGSTKQVKLGKTTVTAGTQVALKAVWANQVASTKVARLNGWAMNY